MITKLMNKVNVRARILNGRQLASSLIERCKTDINNLYAQLGVRPGLAIIQVGNRDDSNIFVRNKIKAAKYLNMNMNVYKFSADCTRKDVLNKIGELNDDDKVHGIVVQLPFDSSSQLCPTEFLYKVRPRKDVDGLHFVNAGKLLYGNKDGDAFVPCAARACHELIRSTGESVVGKHVVIMGASVLVGSPLASILKNEDATVTLCHEKTVNLEAICQSADILVVAIGKPKYVDRNFVKEGAIVIDVGINYDKERKRIVGDVNFDDVTDKASYITPVPGGVGPLTVSTLMLNTFESAKRFYLKSKTM